MNFFLKKLRQRKRGIAFLLCLLFVCTLFSGFTNDIALLSDLSGDDFHASPTGDYVGSILNGSGSYFYEQHNLFSCPGTGYLSAAAYCIEPREPAPNNSTSFSEIDYTSTSTSSIAQKSAAAAVLMYGYGGISSINNDLLGYAPCEQSLGGSFGIYVDNGVARTGLLINGQFYPMYASEAQAVTACAIHKLNGASINTVTGSIYNHNAEVANAFTDLYNIGNWARGNTAAYNWDNTQSFLTGFTGPHQEISLSVQRADGSFVALPANYSSGTFDWSPYIKNNSIVFRASYYATKCESRLIKSNNSTGKLSVSHTTTTTFPDFPNNNGYYDYFSVSEGASNTIPVSVSYQGLKSSSFDTLKLGVIDHNYGGFPPTSGIAFSQEALITINADDIKNGYILDLSITVPKAYTFTPFYGDGDGNGESYAASRFFHSNGYQDIATSSPRGNTSGITTSLHAMHSTGGITLQKQSSDSNINNSNYTLNGASYGLFATKADAMNLRNMLSQSTTNASGTTSFQKLELGTYYVRETKAPNGYKLDPNVYEVNVNSTTYTSLKLSEEPLAVYPTLLLTKTDEEGHPLEAAQFKVDYYNEIFSSMPSNLTPVKSWILSSDIDGKVYLDSNHLLSGDSFYQDKNHKIFLPLGTLTIEEIIAPEGYIKSEEIAILPINLATLDTFQIMSNGRIVENKEITRAFQLVKNGHTPYDETYPLPQAGFMAWKISDLTYDEDDQPILDEASAVVLGSNGEKEIFTDSDGYLCSIPLAYGEYLVRETCTPKDYYPVEDFIINVEEAGNEPLELLELTDEAFYGYIKIYKLDSTTGELIVDNPASFTIWSENDNDYIYYEQEDGTLTNIVTTDETGIFLTPDPLPAGEYLIEEVSAPSNYIIANKSIPITIGLEEYHEAASDNSPYPCGIFSVYCQNEPIWGCIEINKTGEHREWSEEDEDFLLSEIPLENIEFELYAAENIYLPDGHGKLLYEKNQHIETLVTGGNGYAASSKPLPVGTYTLIENTPDIYQETEPIIVSITSEDTRIEQIHDDQITVSYIKHLDIKNYLYIPEMMTFALDIDTDSQTGQVVKEEHIVDNITYTNLIPGRTYTIKGTMVLKANGDPVISNDKEVTGSTTFLCEESEGTAIVSFDLDSTSLQGSSVVLYENLYQEDTLVCVHQDINNEKQTIDYPKANPPKGPKTGDHFPLFSIIILLIASFLTLLFFCISFIITKKK